MDGHRIHCLDHWFPGPRHWYITQQSKLTSKPQLDHKYVSESLQMKFETRRVCLPQRLEARKDKRPSGDSSI